MPSPSRKMTTGFLRSDDLSFLIRGTRPGLHLPSPHHCEVVHGEKLRI